MIATRRLILGSKETDAMIKPDFSVGAWLAILFHVVTASSLFVSAPATAGERHFITLKASAFPSGQLVYEMVSHKVKGSNGADRDFTSRYATGSTIPGPTLVITEGETAEITLEHERGLWQRHGRGSLYREGDGDPDWRRHSRRYLDRYVSQGLSSEPAGNTTSKAFLR